MRVLIVRHGPYFIAGHELRNLKILTEAGIEVDVLCLREKKEPFVEQINEKVRVFRIPLIHKRGGVLNYLFEYFVSFFMMFWAVNILNFFRNYKVVEIITVPDFLVFTGFIPKIFGAKILVHMFDPFPEFFISKFKNKRGLVMKILLNLALKLEKSALSVADKVIFCNNSMRNKVTSRVPKIRSRSFVILNTTLEEPFIKYQKKLQESDKKSKGFTILSHGQIAERYGYQDVIKLLPQLHKSISNLRYRIMGYGNFKDKLVILSKQLKVDNIVEIKGFVPFSKLPSNIADSDVGVIPLVKDDFTEIAFPTRLTEYVLLKIPVICTKTSAITSHFDKNSLFLVDNLDELYQAILKVYKHPDIARQVAENAFNEYMEKYSYEKIRNEYLMIYKTLAGK